MSLDVKQAVERIRARVRRTGGWEGSWAVKHGLTETNVAQWICRGAIPKYWRLALKSILGVAK